MSSSALDLSKVLWSDTPKNNGYESDEQLCCPRTPDSKAGDLVRYVC